MYRFSTFTSLLTGIAVTTIWMKHSITADRTAIENYNFFATVEVQDKWSCAAAILDDLWAMSNRDCIKDAQLSDLIVRVGTDQHRRRGSVYEVVALQSFNMSILRYTDSRSKFTMVKETQLFKLIMAEPETENMNLTSDKNAVYII